MIERMCEAPVHVEACSGLGETRDHFTAKSIAKELGWSRKQANNPANIQYLSEPCHVEKDRPTAHMRDLLVKQKNGLFIGLGDHD